MSPCDGAYYKLLDVSADATVAEIKKAFRRRALVVHPDRNPSEDAHSAFQRLRDVYEILVDPDRRTLYDEGGESAVDGTSDAGLDAAFWASASASLTPEDIVKYEAQYPSSTEEREDLKNHFERFAGKVDCVVDYIPFSEDVDLMRFLKVWDDLIDAGDLEKTEEYKRTRKVLEKRGKKSSSGKAGKAAAKKSKKRAAGGASSGAGGADAALVAMIQNRGSQREKAFNAWADSLAEPSIAKKKRKGKT